MKPVFDIFSKSKKEKEKQPLKVLMDYREKNSLIYSELVKRGFNIEIKELKVADYLINNTAIERKTVSDFTISMINKRLPKQLYELQQYKRRLLIIEGIDEQELYSNSRITAGERNGMHPNAIRGFLLSTLLNYNVPIIFTRDAEDTVEFMSVLARQKPKENSLNVTKKSLNKNEQMQFILEGFPGIGPKTAKKLLGRFRTIQNIINTPKEELEDLIGKKAEIFLIAKNDYEPEKKD